MLIYTEIHTRILHRVEHPVFQFLFIDIKDSGHEVEICFNGRAEPVMVFDAVFKIGQIESDALAIYGDIHFDMTQVHP